MKRYRQYELIPDRPFGYVSVESDDGQYYDACWIRLPVWGYYYNVLCYAEQWGQKVLRWHGRYGFSIDHRFPFMETL